MTLIDVATVAIALDANARPAIQAAMRKLAETGNTATSEGRASLLAQALEVLVAHTSAFTHGFIESTVPLPLEEARDALGVRGAVDIDTDIEGAFWVERLSAEELLHKNAANGAA